MPATLTSAVRNLIDAANFGDTDAFLAAIRRWSDAEFIGQRVTLKVIHFYSTDDVEVVVIAQVGGDGFNGPSTFTFRVADSAVAEMRITA